MLISTQTGHAVGRLGFEQGILALKNGGYDCLDLSLFEMIRDDSAYIAGDWRTASSSISRTRPSPLPGLMKIYAKISQSRALSSRSRSAR